MLRQLLGPILGQADLARISQRLHGEFGLEGMQRPVVPDTVEHVGDEVDRHTTVVLREIASALVGEAGPKAQNVAVLVAQNAVELGRRVDELYGLDVAVTETHRPR